jgi:PAS domain S-box-containing protein
MTVKTPMPEVKIPAPDQGDLIRAGAMLSREQTFKSLIMVLVEQGLDISHSDLAAFYLFVNAGDPHSGLRLAYKRGRETPPDTLSGDSELVRFIRECREALVFNNRDGAGKRPPLFREVLLAPNMASGMVLPVISPSRDIGLLFVNSRKPFFYNRRRFYFLDAYAKLAGPIMQSTRLLGETKEYLRKIEALERYQENIFDSMTNLIITADSEGQIHYFNRAAAEAMGLDETCLGRDLREVFYGALSSKTLKTITASFENGGEIPGLEGIYRRDGREMDYALNLSPLRTPRGKREGVTLLFTNQTREKELREKVNVVSEERRMIKDMFCRYMSNEVVSRMMEYPESVKLGGDKKNATVFFADIRGYTSFSEGREPEEIIEILNGYFGEAVEQVLTYRGYIDKFIGDCIMAVWGIPMPDDEDGAVSAVSCALAIQSRVSSPRRNFFLKDASRLKIGIGINTGPLVAGNLGSLRRMDYSVIGDTVNLASRLEGIAGADEIIISQATRDRLGERFRLERRSDVRVKGKGRPVQIYNVLGFT